MICFIIIHKNIQLLTAYFKIAIMAPFIKTNNIKTEHATI